MIRKLSASQASSSAEVEAPSDPPAASDSASRAEAEAFRPDLPSFRGPLDLLLYLIHKNEVDIFDIPISLILEQYLAHLDELRRRGDLKLQEAGEFMVMSARLMEIKSRLLLPVVADESEDEALEVELVDPRESLVEQLLEYQDLKDRAVGLEQSYEQRSQRYERALVDPVDEEEPLLDLSKVSAWDLGTALMRVLELASEREHVAVIEVEDEPIEVSMERVEEALVQGRGRIAFEEAFDIQRGRKIVISTFLAILELAKRGRLSIEQASPFDRIYLCARDLLA